LTGPHQKEISVCNEIIVILQLDESEEKHGVSGKSVGKNLLSQEKLLFFLVKVKSENEGYGNGDNDDDKA